MNKLLRSLSVVLTSVMVAMAPIHVDAKRLGGGRPAGMQRSIPAKQPNQVAPPQQGTPNQAGQQQNNAVPPNGGAMAGAANAAGKRSWMGPIAGLAAGLGIAALMSHFGMGAALGNFMTMALVALAAVFVIGWLMKRFGGATRRPADGGLQYAGAGMNPAGGGYAPANPGGNPYPSGPSADVLPMQRAATSGALPGSFAAQGGLNPAVTSTIPAVQLPDGVSTADFERVAKMLFIRMQAANDAGLVDDLRKFTTPELFASLRLDLQERGAAAQQTDVVELNAELVDTARENDQWVASVRFHGQIKEATHLPVEPFNELWHFVKPADGSRDWAIAGISPVN